MQKIKKSVLQITFIIYYLISISFLVSSTCAKNPDDTLISDSQTSLFYKYLKLSEDEVFQLHERKLFSEKAMQIAKSLNKTNEIMLAMASKGYISAQEGDYTKAFTIFNRLTKLSDSVGYTNLSELRRKAYLANAMGLIYKELGEYDTALNLYYKSLTICDSIVWKEGKSAALNNISTLYNLVGNTKEAFSILYESELIAKSEHYNSLLFDIYINLMDMYIKTEVYDSALVNGQKAYDLSIKLNSTYNQAFLEVGFGKLFSKQQQFSKAAASLKKCISISKEGGFDEIYLEALIELAYVYRQQNNLKKAKALLGDAEKIDKIINIPVLHIKLLLEQSELNHDYNNYEQALELHKKAIYFKDSINASWEKMKYAEIQSLYSIKLEKQRNMVLEKDISIKQFQIKQQKLFIIISIVFLIILTGLVILFYRKRKFEQETNKLLKEQNKKINSQEKIIRLKNEQSFKQELDYKNRQLATFSLAALKQSESFIIIIEKINELLYQQSIKSTTRRKLEQLISQIRPLNSQKEWEEFRSYFEAVHPSFYFNLKNAAPDLTLNEQKICAYIRLGMNTKEIASITYRQVRSVESTRFRIRKKIGLTANDKLFEFMEAL